MASERSTQSSTDPKVTIHILRGRATRNSRPMKGPTLLIGSQSHCDVQMRSPEVAGKHCLISRRRQQVLVTQLDPNFPVLLNGSAVAEAPIQHGDKLTIGPFELSVTIEGGVAVPEEPETTNVSRPEMPSASQPAMKPLPSKTTAPPLATPGEKVTAGTADGPRPVYATQDTDERRQKEEWIRLEAERKELERLKQKLQEQREGIDRGFREQSDREQELVAKQREMHEQEKQLAASAQEIEQQRLSVTEEMLELDNRQRKIDHYKSRLGRVRRRVFEQARDRRGGLGERAAELEKKSREVELQQRELEREIAHWKQVGQDLAQREAQINERADLFQTRKVDIDKDERELITKRNKLDQELQNVRVKERSLETLKEDLQQRKIRLVEEEVALKTARETVDKEFQEVRERAAAVQSRHEEVEGKSRLLEKQEQHLKERAVQIEGERLAHLDRERDIAGRGSEIEQREANCKTREEECRRRVEELNVREQTLLEQVRQFEKREKELEQVSAYHAQRSVEIDKRAAELEASTNTIVVELDQDRAALKRDREELDREKSLLDQERQRLLLQQDQSLSRFSEVREKAVELAQRTSILRCREASIDSVSRGHLAQLEEIDRGRKEIETTRADLQLRSEALERQQKRLGDQAEAQSAESKRLEELANALESRQQEVLGREHDWVDEVRSRRDELEELAGQLERKRQVLDRDIMAHRRHVNKLREVSLKVVQRRRDIHNEMRDFQTTETINRQQVELLRDNLRRLRSTVASYLEDSSRRDRERDEWMRSVGEDNAVLGELSGEVADQMNAMLGQIETRISTNGSKMDGDAGGAIWSEVRGLVTSLGAWSERFTRMKETFRGRAASEARHAEAMVSGRNTLSRLIHLIEETGERNESVFVVAEKSPQEPAAESRPAIAEHHQLPIELEHDDIPMVTHEIATPTPRDVAPATPEIASTPPGAEVPAEEPEEPVVSLPMTGMEDREFVQRLMQTGLCDETALKSHEHEAANRGTTLQARLLETGALSEYQLGCLAENRLDELNVGSATILDRLHRGATATTYKVRLGGYDQPMALRILDPRWSRDESMRSTYAITVNAMTDFRHPNVANLHELFVTDAGFGVVCDYVDGWSVGKLSGYGVPTKAIVHMCHQAVSAIAAAQRRGFVHHNLRPSRIMMTLSGETRLLGYGEPAWLSKIHRCERGRAITSYLPPEELLTDGSADARGDLFSVAVIAAELATGTRAAVGQKLDLPGDFPRGFSALLTRLLQERPQQRCSSVGEVLDILEEMVLQPSMEGDPWPELPQVVNQLANQPSEQSSRKAA
ncbi:Serine/threonine-protein kinase PknL [Planctomycetes bacterium Pan216]|uniref:Serine/threonine-protein kinase PknL n=1 Tax=Kolteria novifilia TaxID=2527975 RepID=A0A518B1I4_9BACT|nr:Serine/threonine-protein kinase PknL [Planctomycetes bacterium Pan216]